MVGTGGRPRIVKIVKTGLRAKGPYVMAVNLSYGLRRARLAYPPD